MTDNLDREASTALAHTQGVAALRGAQLVSAALAAMDAPKDQTAAAVGHLTGEILTLLHEQDTVKQVSIVEYLAYRLASLLRDMKGSTAQARTELTREAYLLCLNAHRQDGGQFLSVTELTRLSHAHRQDPTP